MTLLGSGSGQHPLRASVARPAPRACALLSCLFGLAVLAVLTVVAGCGEQTTPQGASWFPPPVSGLFDPSTVHELSVSFAQADYDAMLETYKTSGEKSWMRATVKIDGKTYDNVGIRLKGNSSLMRLKGRVPGGVAAGAGDRQAPAFPQGANTGAQAARSEELPWLIDLDKYVDGRNHCGVVELAVRSNVTATALNEAVAVALVREAGLASQDTAYVRFSVNGSEPRLRLVIENPDDMWMAKNLAVSGALYKAESSGDYSYRGQDPKAYEGVFDQEAGKKNADLTPLIEFLDFLNNADDATFKAELPSRLDVAAFADYLAIEELMANFDDIDGPGNNSYLYYDPGSDRFTVVAWDHNLAFGVRQRAEGIGPARGAPERQVGSAPNVPERQVRSRANVLVNRFKAVPEWSALCEERKAALDSALYQSGKAAQILDYWAELLRAQAQDLVSLSVLSSEAAQISAYFAGHPPSVSTKSN